MDGTRSQNSEVRANPFKVQGLKFKVSVFDRGLERLDSERLSSLGSRGVGGRWNEAAAVFVAFARSSRLGRIEIARRGGHSERLNCRAMRSAVIFRAAVSFFALGVSLCASAEPERLTRPL